MEGMPCSWKTKPEWRFRKFNQSKNGLEEDGIKRIKMRWRTLAVWLTKTEGQNWMVSMGRYKKGCDGGMYQIWKQARCKESAMKLKLQVGVTETKGCTQCAWRTQVGWYHSLFYVSTQLSENMLRYLVKHYSGHFCEGVCGWDCPSQCGGPHPIHGRLE